MVRFLENLAFPNIRIWSLFPSDSRRDIASLVRDAERGHSGEIRLCIEGSLPLVRLIAGETSRSRAESIFSSERVWDTAQNSGILIYLLLSERKLEIIYDRGIVLSEEQRRLFSEAFLARAKEGMFVQAFEDLFKLLQPVLQRTIPCEDDTAGNEISDSMLMMP